MDIFTSNEIEATNNELQKFIVKFCKNKSSAECLQSLQNLDFKDKTKKVILQLLLTHILRAESVAAGGFEGFISKLTTNIDPIQARVFNSSSIKNLLSTFAVDEKLVNLIFDSLQLAGLKGKVVLSQHPVNGEQDVIELNRSCFFDDLTCAFDLKSTKFLNPRLVCIDGFIESVSEAHRILQDASESKETIILFVRGLSEEVLHTLKVNYDRGSLRLIPVFVKYDLESVNLLNDIATINCSDVVSIHKGELISNIDITRFSRVDSIDITPTGVGIENETTSTIVDLHIKKLQQKYAESNNQYEKDSITKRIQNLGMNRVTIRLKDTQDKKRRSLEIDRSLRAIKDARNFGICELNSKLYPYAGIKAGEFFANKFLQTIKEIQTIVID